MRCRRTLPWILALLAAVAVDRAAAQDAAVAPTPPADTGPPPVDASRQGELFVIPAGAEPLFADMLGSGQALPGGCKFTDGQIERTTVIATYACQDGQVVLELHHPDGAPAGAARTQRFALVPKSGTAPAGLTDAIVQRIRAREGEFEWKAVGQPAGGGLRRVLPIAAGVVVAALLFWAVRRFGSRRSSAQ